MIPVVDLFAGPGGLGEGFSALETLGERLFKIVLSIEKDATAHSTLELRAFFRQFPSDEIPEAYYQYLAGDISRHALLAQFPAEARNARAEAWHAELGGAQCPPELVDARIRQALGKHQDWVLIGGPPCQAYSLVGRSRVIGREGLAKYEADPRHELYRHYLRILSVHRPPVFVMENVKGLLSAKIQSVRTFERIIGDLENPVFASKDANVRGAPVRYRLVSLVVPIVGAVGRCEPKDFVVRAEDYGVPQARHRIVIVGIREDRERELSLLQKQAPVEIQDVLSDLPRLRSGLSRETDTPETWYRAIREIKSARWYSAPSLPKPLGAELRAALRLFSSGLSRGSPCMSRTRRVIRRHREWFDDKRLRGICNHESRSHIRADLHRYFFISVFGRAFGRSPLLNDLPKELLPNHKNVAEALATSKFNDRFRVQCEGRPSTTVTSHISRDGHYFIHYDAEQCRSLTVREAARLQTFPDNYFFEGARTHQYQQVGNAVPPLLARQIAHIVSEIFL